MSSSHKPSLDVPGRVPDPVLDYRAADPLPAPAYVLDNSKVIFGFGLIAALSVGMKFVFMGTLAFVVFTGLALVLTLANWITTLAYFTNRRTRRDRRSLLLVFSGLGFSLLAVAYFVWLILFVTYGI